MASKKLIFCTGEGIGNVVQTIPTIRTLKEVLGYEIDFWHAFGSFPVSKIISYVDKWIVGSNISKIDPSDYVGKVSTFWTRNHIDSGSLHKLELLNAITPLSAFRSEVDTYMDIARDLGVKEEDIIWEGDCNYMAVESVYDVVIHNGYNAVSPANWQIKSYPYYEDVAFILEDYGLNVCSIGSRKEYVRNTKDNTGFPLLSSLGVIKNSKVFLGNDSGLYHCANALGVRNVVIFTASSITKNYDKRFHKYSTIVGRNDLGCRTDCQARRGWSKDCKSWDCREIPPSIIADAIKEQINNA